MSVPASIARERDTTWLRLALFFVVSWWAATLFLGGDLGQWNDDYAYDRRNAASGESELAFGGLVPGYFYRPGYYLIVPTLITGLPPTVVHWVSAGAHLLAGVLLWALLRRLGCDRRISAASATLFVVWPAHWEVALWPSALPTGLAVSTFLSLALFMSWCLQQSQRWWMPVLCALVGFAVPCLNEQPAACFPGLALLGLVIRRTGDHPARALLRSTCLAMGAALGACVYIALYIATAPAGVRGASGTFTPPAEFFDKIGAISGAARRFLLLRDFRKGALVEGCAVLSQHPVLTASLLVLLLIGASALLRPRNTVSQEDRPASDRPALGALVGFGIFVLAWVPAVLVRSQGVEPRLCYIPVMGFCLALACLSQAAEQRAIGRARAAAIRNIAMSLALVCAALVTAVAMIGIQGALRARWTRDEWQATQLRALLPGPLPSSILVPVSIRDRAAGTGDERFDRYFFGPLQRPWSAPFYARRALKRPGFTATWSGTPEEWSPLVGASERGLLYDDSRLHPFEQLHGDFELMDGTRKVLPWRRVIPFVIEADGQVALVGSFVVMTRDGQRARFEPPQTSGRKLEILFEPGGTMSIRHEP